MNKLSVSGLIITTCIIVSGCTSTPEQKAEEKYQIEPSFLQKNAEQSAHIEALVTPGSESLGAGELEQFEQLSSVHDSLKTGGLVKLSNIEFSESEMVTLASNDMPIVEFIHYTFGEILGVNYIVGNGLKNDTQKITLNIKQAISKKDLFSKVADVLTRYQVSIDENNQLFYLDKSPLSKAKAQIGIGAAATDVPNVSGQILQVIPIEYGIRLSIERTLRQLVDAQVTTDFDQSAFFVLGDRANVLRAIELVSLLDVPANRGKFIGLLSLTYLSTQDFLEQVPVLMRNEGLDIGVGDEASKSTRIVPLDQIGAVAIFASSENILERVKYWGGVVDRPVKGEAKQYFVYNPQYARASDLGESISGLLSLGGRPIANNQNSTGSNADQLQSQQSQNSTTVSGQDISYVVDERSNSLIFSSTSTKYQTLLPLLKKLDVLPKQVMLEVLIAEVTLTGSFEFGVEFALRNSSRFNFTDIGAFNAGNAGGLASTFTSISGEALASFFETSSFVNTLSNPTLLVRDGVNANISVGTEIPVLSAAITDPVNGLTQSIEYRTTGVQVDVTPTVNAQGIVIMNISQSISNQVDSTASAIGSPSIFTRDLNTEVVVKSGETILMGGLISETKSDAESRVPGFGSLPLLGNLFKGKDQESNKTELVLLVTPKVIENNDEWEKIMKEFQNGLDNIRIVN